MRGLLKFEFILIYLGFFNPQDTTILLTFPVAVFLRVIILVSVHGGCVSGMFIERICEQLNCYQEAPDVSTTCQ